MLCLPAPWEFKYYRHFTKVPPLKSNGSSWRCPYCGLRMRFSFFLNSLVVFPAAGQLFPSARCLLYSHPFLFSLLGTNSDCCVLQQTSFRSTRFFQFSLLIYFPHWLQMLAPIMTLPMALLPFLSTRRVAVLLNFSSRFGSVAFFQGTFTDYTFFLPFCTFFSWQEPPPVLSPHSSSCFSVASPLGNLSEVSTSFFPSPPFIIVGQGCFSLY